MSNFNKLEAKKELYKFLEAKGFPKMAEQDLIDALPDMYRLLEGKNMLPDGINFAIFKQVALIKHREAAIMSKFQGFLGGRTF